ncbi:type VII secretion protein EccB [Corynebacterium anserum]|uniref:Type VII secretion protein EccB n=1 Tax=Corynebacterium anserum TaxID=2684406 RepID=A0A7G7YPY6_9CORY|nr:type VII secretion protein EccB [Corynebacterium anserum]QNH96556.1 type VII secretion protein EccB [Corynebacterium anserum]
MRTTGIQVSGYGFLLRRLELALVIGDPRMAHDPLRSQRRAIFVGVLASLLIAGGAVMLGLLRPQPSIGETPLVVDESGTLHVRLEDAFHPITNVASARLVLRQPAEVQKTTSEQLAQFPIGDSMGIAIAPGLVHAPKREFLFCEPGVVLASPEVRWHEHAVLESPSGTWLVAGQERFKIDATSPLALGAPTIPVSDGFAGQFVRKADVTLPKGKTMMPAPFDVAGRVLLVGDRAFMASQGGIAEITGPRRELAEALSTHPPIYVSLQEVVEKPRVEVLEGVPQHDVQWAEPEMLCAGSKGLGEPQGMQLPNEVGKLRQPQAPAYDGEHFFGPRGTSAVVTERGFALVSENGLYFSIGREEDIEVLGFPGVQSAPWRVLSVLPNAGLLSEDNARAINVTMPTTNTNRDKAPGTE